MVFLYMAPDEKNKAAGSTAALQGRLSPQLARGAAAASSKAQVELVDPVRLGAGVGEAGLEAVARQL